MTGVRIWLRRLWMLSGWDGATLLLSPTAAAIAAYLVIRQLPAEVRQVMLPLRRHVRPVFGIVVAVWLQGLVVQLVTLGFGVAACALAGADPRGLTMPWQLLTGPVALPAAILAGAAIAGMFTVPWTVPGVAIAMFLAHRVFYWEGYPELFTLEAATGAMPDARPLPSHLMATIAINILIALARAAVLVYQSGAARVRSRLALPVAVVTVLAAIAVFLPWMLAHNMDTYERL